MKKLIFFSLAVTAFSLSVAVSSSAQSDKRLFPPYNIDRTGSCQANGKNALLGWENGEGLVCSDVIVKGAGTTVEKGNLTVSTGVTYPVGGLVVPSDKAIAVEGAMWIDTSVSP